MNKLEKLPDHIVIKFLNFVKRLIVVPDTLGEFHHLMTQGLRKDLIEAISGPLGRFEDRLSIEYLYYLLVRSTDDKVVRPTKLNEVSLNWVIRYKIVQEDTHSDVVETYFDSVHYDDEYLKSLWDNEDLDPHDWDREIELVRSEPIDSNWNNYDL
jgi:hypothetical protein